MIWDPTEGDPPVLLRPAASVGAALFSAVTRARGRMFDLGWLNAAKVDRPVISVGNLAVGGTGKTPFTALLASRIDAKVAIVSRGYGRRDTSDALVVVSKGEGPIVDVAAAGDEPFLLAQRTNACVVVCAERARGARHAIEALGADVVLLDDGFQHRRLKRDVDLVLLDAHVPFGNGCLLPRGPLREPVAALERATGLVLNHGAVECSAIDVPIDKPTVEVIEHAEVTAEIEGRRVALLSGIARPSRFVNTVRGLGGEVVHTFAARDHAWFDAATLEGFFADARDAEVLLTTEKDAVRMPPEVAARFAVVRLEHRILRGEDVLDRLVAEALA